MTLWAIVPVKPLRRGKSRLASVLTQDERTALNQSMLINSLRILASVQEIDKILVVSRDPSVLSIAREYGAKTVLEDGNPELNTALNRAAVVANTYFANEILVIPADLPLLKQTDLQYFLKHTGKPPEVVLAPDRRKDGTNALFINPAGLIHFRFGPGSFQKHILLAEQAKARIEIVDLPSFALDLDLPEDLEILKSIQENA